MKEGPLRFLFFSLLTVVHAVAPVVFLTHQTENPYSVQIVFLQSMVLLIWGILGIALWRKTPSFVNRTPLDVPLLLFGLWAGFTWGLSAWQHGPFFRSGIFHQGLERFIFLWVNGIGVFFLATQFSRPAELFFFRRLVLGVAGLCAGYGILQFLGADPLWKDKIDAFGGRPLSTYGNPNFLASAMVLTLPLSVHEFLEAKKQKTQWGWGLLALSLVIVLTATLTRSSWIGAVAALATLAVLDPRPFLQNKKRMAVATGAVVLLFFFWPHSPTGSDLLKKRITDLWTGMTGVEIYAPWHQRLLIWRAAWDMWTEQFWTGKGWGLFEVFFPYYQGRFLIEETFRSFRTHSNNAHQLLLEFSSQTGTVGLGLVLWMGILTLTLEWKNRRAAPGATPSPTAALLSGVVGMGVDNFFGNVSLFFAVPGFLFFWAWGQWAGHRGQSIQWKGEKLFFRRSSAILLILLSGVGTAHLVRGFAAEMAFFQGSLTNHSGHPQRGERELLRAWSLNRFDVTTNFELANLYSHRMEEARSAGFPEQTHINAERSLIFFTHALQSNPGYDELYLGRARALQILGRTPEIEKDLRLALLIHPLRLDVTLWLDSLLTKPSQRLPFLRSALSAFPDDPILRLRQAQVQEQSGNRREAQAGYEWVLRRDLENPDAWAGLQRTQTGPLSPFLGNRIRAGVTKPVTSKKRPSSKD